MGIEGHLQDVSLADICQLLSMGRKTGCLTVTDRSSFGYVYFKDGRVIYATVLNRPDRLGDLLVRNNVISRAELSVAMESQANYPGKRLGQILVERGDLTSEQLNRFITIQIEEAVYHLFTWEQGSFHFDPDQAPDEHGGMLVSINAESLLLEGARRVDELSLIEKKIPSVDLIFAVERLPGPEDDVQLTKEQQKILALLDGHKTVHEVIDESGLVEFEGIKVLYGLLQAGFVYSSGQREAVASAGEDVGLTQRLSLGNAFYRAGMLEEAEREYGAVVEADPKRAVARSRLALIALRAEKPAKALEHLDALPDKGNGGVILLRNRAVALEQLGRYAEAIEALDRALALSPDDPRLILARAIVRFKNHQPEAALEGFQKYRRTIAKEDTPSPMYFAYALLAAGAAGEMDDALHLGREGMTSYPGNGAILVNLGVLLERRGESDAAEALYLRAVGEAPPPPQGHKNLGDLAYRRGDQAGARAHYERALRLNSRLGDDVYLKLGNIVYKEGDRDWALQLWRKALELNPANEVVRTNLELMGSAAGR